MVVGNIEVVRKVEKKLAGRKEVRKRDVSVGVIHKSYN